MARLSDDEKKMARLLFRKIGLEPNMADVTTANDDVTKRLRDIISEAGVEEDGCDSIIGNLLYKVATEYLLIDPKHRSTLIRYIVSSEINSNAKLYAAFKFVEKTASEKLRIDDFEEACGAGVEVSEEDIRAAIKEVLERSDDSTSYGKLFGSVMEKQPWADTKLVKNLLEASRKITETKPEKKKKKKKNPENKKNINEKAPEKEEEDPFAMFSSPEENLKVHTEIPFSDGRVLKPCNSERVLEKHLMITTGKIRTRFPISGFDDTNPEAEKEEYINHINEIVSWMGWNPFKITYTSDYFDQLYEFAVELIKRGCAYVDHQTPEDIKVFRKNRKNSCKEKYR